MKGFSADGVFVSQSPIRYGCQLLGGDSCCLTASFGSGQLQLSGWPSLDTAVSSLEPLSRTGRSMVSIGQTFESSVGTKTQNLTSAVPWMDLSATVSVTAAQCPAGHRRVQLLERRARCWLLLDTQSLRRLRVVDPSGGALRRG